ncbi:hypothetical protein BofuT4_uP054700.1 [Botrytis cinerea T4]|uniref:Uncharacterized protein n=1 Tax=Botryotinia fuckeliana (strain T4) TaxID=999810 RepID=G2XVP9_BOTF4|nr:hypothetical protein BofuT4_uP054700.1 [Botrytis cinerea T4]
MQRKSENVGRHFAGGVCLRPPTLTAKSTDIKYVVGKLIAKAELRRRPPHCLFPA